MSKRTLHTLLLHQIKIMQINPWFWRFLLFCYESVQHIYFLLNYCTAKCTVQGEYLWVLIYGPSLRFTLTTSLVAVHGSVHGLDVGARVPLQARVAWLPSARLLPEYSVSFVHEVYVCMYVWCHRSVQSRRYCYSWTILWLRPELETVPWTHLLKII